MIARIVWGASLVIVALVTVGLQFDRQARRSPAIAAGVPEVFRSASQYPYAAFAIQDGSDPIAALAEAERLVRRRPMPAEHLRLLAQAQIVAGQVQEGSMSIQYAAQRGWRDPLVQESMLRLALAAGDQGEAARRFAALFLRRDTEDALLEELGPQVLSEPGGEGRSTLVTIVGGGERWHAQFLGRGARIMPPDAFAEIVSKTDDAGTRYDCDALGLAVRATEQRDKEAGAVVEAIHSSQC